MTKPKNIWKLIFEVTAITLWGYVLAPSLVLFIGLYALNLMPTSTLEFVQYVIFAFWLRVTLEYVAKTIGDAWYGSKYNRQK